MAPLTVSLASTLVSRIEGSREVADPASEGGRDFRSLLGPALRARGATGEGGTVTGGATDCGVGGGLEGVVCRTVRLGCPFEIVLRLPLRKSFAWTGIITPSASSSSLENLGVKANACAKFQCSSAVSGSFLFTGVEVPECDLCRWLGFGVGRREVPEMLSD